MTVYLDSSVVLSWLLNQEPSLEEWGHWQAGYTSELCRVEFYRTIDRLRLDGDLDDHERVLVHERFVTFWNPSTGSAFLPHSSPGQASPSRRSSARWMPFT